MTLNKSTNQFSKTSAVILAGALIVVVALLLLAVQMSDSVQLGARYQASVSPDVEASIVNQKFQCSASCLCVYESNAGSPVPSPRRRTEADQAEWTSCVSVKRELENDAAEACQRTCQANGGYQFGYRNVSCDPLGDC